MSNLIKSAKPGNHRQVIQLTTIVDPELTALNNESGKEAQKLSLADKVNEAKRKAAGILKEANLKREAIEREIKEKNEQAEKSREEAFKQKEKQGFDQGFRKGVEEGKRSCLKKINQANRLIEQAQSACRDYIKEAEPEILKLSVAIAQKIIGASIAADEGKWFSLVSEAVKEVRDQETIKITVYPSHFKELNDRRQELKAIAPQADIIIYATSECRENDCTIETSFGKIEAGVDSQLSLIKEKLIELMEERGL
ncbi:flagellar assembly protein FliH [Sporolactobacillus sp. THM7-4]|nr:flagellar assembly protein FliH [Sporolactobacillus sp. THM7-4]